MPSYGHCVYARRDRDRVQAGRAFSQYALLLFRGHYYLTPWQWLFRQIAFQTAGKEGRGTVFAQHIRAACASFRCQFQPSNQATLSTAQLGKQMACGNDEGLKGAVCHAPQRKQPPKMDTSCICFVFAFAIAFALSLFTFLLVSFL